MDGFGIAKFRDEFRQVTVRHGRVMPAGKLLPLGQDQGQVPAPGSRILSRSKAAGFRVIKHRLDPAAEARSCFWNPAPNRLQDAKHRLRVDCVDWLIENRPAVIIDRCAPLRRVDLAAPFAPFRSYERSGAFAEGSTPGLGFPGGLLCGQRVNLPLASMER